MSSDLARLQQVIGYAFRDADLLVRALRHASTTLDRTHSNERLEFLGDRVLGLSVAHMLYERFETEDEGPLARRFAGLTSRDALAQVAASLNLKDFIRTQSGDAETEERSQSSITADTLEAVLGAIYLDGGLDPAWAFIAKNWEHLIDKDLSAPKDAKTALQEWAQARNLGLPSYEVVDREGPDHAPTFTVCVTVKGHAPQFGQSNSRRSAEQDAAQKLLTKLET